MTTKTPPFACRQCGTRYQLRDERQLRNAARSTCQKCRTRFVVFVTAEKDSPARDSSAAVDKPTRPRGEGTTPSSLAAKAAALELSFHGHGGSLFGIHIVNILKTLLSLGVYYFWGKVRVRNYLFSQTEFAGDRFAYHGTGKELLIGFLKALLVFGVPYAVLQLAPGLLNTGTGVRVAAALLAAGLFMVCVPVAMVSARRYRLSRASWRGIRFSFRGRTWDFVNRFFKGALLTALTLGAYYPVFQTRLHDVLVSQTHVGNRPFRFDGSGWELASRFVVVLMVTPVAVALPALLVPLSGSALPLVLLPVTVGPLWIWFLAGKQRYFWDHTTFEEARFRCTVTGRRLLNLKAENFFLLLLTLGFAWPWVTVRNVRFITENLTLEGLADFEGIVQDPRAAASTGEGLTELLDAGFDLG